MTVAALDDGGTQSRLGTLELPVEQRERDAAAAFEHLRKLGLTSPRPGLRNAVSVALVHVSYYHENSDALPGTSKATLQALSRVGGAFLQKIAAADIYRRTATDSAGKVSKSVAEIVSAFPAWTVDQEWLRDSAALSVGIDRERLSPKVTSILFRQVLGVLCVEGEEDVATRLLTDLFTAVRRRQEHGIGDPKTVLQEQLGRSIVTYAYEREGPDHATVFHAVATDTQGRRVEGKGSNKKAASQQAALNFLQQHFPSIFANSGNRGTPRPLALEIPAPESHARAVRRLQDLFSLPATVRPLFSQALIHASWTHENQWAMARYRQQDHQVLAHVGSHVLIYEHSIAVARRAVVDSRDGAPYTTLPDRVYDTAFYEAGLSSALLLGVGQRSLGIPEEAGADTFQAVIGAVYAAMDFRGSLADIWPKEWGQIWQLIAPSDPWPIDPTSRLQQAASAMKLRMEFEYVRSGPDHAPQYVATVILESSALGLETRAKGTAEVGKTPAKHTASKVVLSVLARLADNSIARSFDDASKRDYALARFLLSQQAFLLDTAPVPIPRWIDAKLFGLHLAPNAAALLDWAAGVDQLLGLKVSLRPDSHLRTAFKDLVESSADPDRTLDTALSRSMDTLERIQVPEQLETPYLQYLVHLCDVHRCLGAQDPDINLQELARDWHVLHRGQVDAVVQPPDVRLSGRERAVLDAALSAVLAARGRTSVEFLGHRPMRLRFRSTTPLPRASTEEICALWSRVTRTTTLEATECGIDAVVTTADAPIEPGPITQAVEAALQPTAQPYRAAVADLLHDLKNQLVAARSAASQPTEGRTARLQQQLTASRHLDEAHSLAQRVRAASSLLEPARNESVEIGKFLRQYARGVLDRLPGNISLSIPEASTAVRVALGERALTAVLNNLIGNAIEALGDGGAITLAWTADEYEAVVEVADNGPGLPPQVAAAFATGQRVQSTKPGGNGLGLLSVRSLLAGAGGQLSLAPAQSGAAWLITLPTATTTSEHE